MRFSSQAFKTMVSEIVRQEIREVVAQTISEVLSERYLMKLAEAAAHNRPRGVADLDIQGDDEQEEEVPHTLANTILGVGQEDPVFKKEPSSKRVVQTEGRDRNEMLNLFFEGVKPLDQREAEAPEMTGVVLPKNDSTMSRWKELAMAQGSTHAAEAVSPEQKDPEAEAARIKMWRDKLNNQKVG